MNCKEIGGPGWAFRFLFFDKGGVFAINDSMQNKAFGDVDAFAQKLRDMGYQDVHFVDTTKIIFGSSAKASMLFLPGSRMLAGRK